MKVEKVLIAILSILVIALGGYIGYDKFLNKSTKSSNEKEQIQIVEKTENNQVPEENETVKTKESNVIETRTCTGIYSGTGVTGINIQTKENIMGIVTIELKNDGTYKTTYSNSSMYDSGTYTIIENALLFKQMPEICDSTVQDCSAIYTSFLDISKDCATISHYNPYYTLTKQN